MKLIDINKTRYRNHLNKIIIGFIAVFMLLALVFGQGLIAIFTDSVVNGEQSNNFRYNLAGVILALLACAAILSQLREHPYFHEVYYVWRLKQVLNLIYRKLRFIKAKAEQNETSALIILNYYYQASQQLYLLDDNTITISSLNKELESVKEKISTLGLNISTDDFEQSMLKSYK